MAYKRSAQYGGQGGNAFSDDLTETQALVSIIVRHGTYVDAIQASWELVDGTTRQGTQHGGNGGTPETIELQSGEYITRVAGRSGTYVDQLTFQTNLGNSYGPYGGNGGATFEIPRLPQVGGFFGRSGSYLDAVGVFYPA